jgi:hypothetical protein
VTTIMCQDAKCPYSASSSPSRLTHRSLADSEAAAILAAAKLDADRIRASAQAEADELRRASAAASARATAAAQTALAMSSRAGAGGVDTGAEGGPGVVVIKSLADLAGEPLLVSSSGAKVAERPAAAAAPAPKRQAWGADDKENAGVHGRAAEEADTEIAAMLRAQRRQVRGRRCEKMVKAPSTRSPFARTRRAPSRCARLPSMSEIAAMLRAQR